MKPSKSEKLAADLGCWQGRHRIPWVFHMDSPTIMGKMMINRTIGVLGPFSKLDDFGLQMFL